MILTIFSRLMIGYFAIFSLVISVSVYAILRLNQLNTGTHHILNIDNRILDYEEKLADSTLSQLRYEKKYVLTKDILLHDQFLSAKGDFSKFLSELLLIVDTPEKKDLLSKIQTHYQRFQSLIDKEIEYVRGNRSYPKRGYEQEIEKASDHFHKRGGKPLTGWGWRSDPEEAKAAFDHPLRRKQAFNRPGQFLIRPIQNGSADDDLYL